MSDILADKDYWDRHAQRDPLWAILSDSTKRDGQWDVAKFFQTGTREIASLFYELDAQALLPRRGSALDFGCGVGRLTQALAPHFDRVTGVDISPRMQQLATRINQHPQTVSYVSNQVADLRVFADRSFDFIVSSIVLQHIRPEIACSYLREFFRVLAPAGIAVFQLPSHRRRWRSENRPLESSVNPMPEDAYRASIVATGMPREINPAGEVTLQLAVTNVSGFDWIQREYGVLSVGNHWFEGAGGQMLTRDDGRTRLPATLRAGETCHLSLTISAPPSRGFYECEIDLAHEGIRWFHDLGSDVVRFAVQIGEDEVAFEPPPDRVSRTLTTPPIAAPDGQRLGALGAGGAKGNVDDPGEFPMYGVAVNSVVRLVADHGATLLHIENDRSCGDEWVSYRYFVRAAELRDGDS